MLCLSTFRSFKTIPMTVLIPRHSLSSSSKTTFDIVVAGGGMVGSSAAVALSKLGNFRYLNKLKL